MVTVNAGGTWSATAAAAPGSALHSDIVRWANTLKARPGRTMFAFNHEPEASGNTSRGTAEDFKRAWRRVVDIFRQQGVTNVDYTLQMTDWSYRTSTTDVRHVSRWYPGDAYVDILGADAYNWNTWPRKGTLGGVQDAHRPRDRLRALSGQVGRTAGVRERQRPAPCAVGQQRPSVHPWRTAT